LTKNIEKKYNNANEELEALKIQYYQVISELDQYKSHVKENIHEHNSDQQELKLINDDLSKELRFNKAVLYKYVSSEVIGKLREKTTYDDINKN
jgi:hypothetical protein